jgi:hypothetical protein
MSVVSKSKKLTPLTSLIFLSFPISELGTHLPPKLRFGYGGNRVSGAFSSPNRVWQRGVHHRQIQVNSVQDCRNCFRVIFEEQGILRCRSGAGMRRSRLRMLTPHQKTGYLRNPVLTNLSSLIPKRTPRYATRCAQSYSGCLENHPE